MGYGCVTPFPPILTPVCFLSALFVYVIHSYCVCMCVFGWFADDELWVRGVGRYRYYGICMYACSVCMWEVGVVVLR